MFFYLVMLGVIMGWVESVYPKREPPDDDDTPEIPLFLRRFPDRRPSSIPVLEPDDTPLLADAYLRAGGGG